jgi:hypothetical protein
MVRQVPALHLRELPQLDLCVDAVLAQLVRPSSREVGRQRGHEYNKVETHVLPVRLVLSSCW